MAFHRHFNLLTGRSPGFGSAAANYTRPVRTRFRFASGMSYLKLACGCNSPDRSTKSTKSHVNVLFLLVSTGFQVLFHSPSGVLFTFPSRYCFSIGHQVVFWLGGWSPRFPAGFHVSGGTPDQRQIATSFGYGSFTLCGKPSHAFLLKSIHPHAAVHTPLNKSNGLAFSAFARHY